MSKPFLKFCIVAATILLIASVAPGQFRPFELPRPSQAPPQAPVMPDKPAPSAPEQPTPEPQTSPMAPPQEPRRPFRNPFDEVLVEYTGAQVAEWMTYTIDEIPCRVSPAITFPAGLELNHYEAAITYSGEGDVKISVAHGPNSDINNILTKKHLHRPFQAARSGEPRRFSSPYRQETTAWMLVATTGDVQITGVQFRCLRGRGTVFGHTPMTFNFAGVELPYRLLAPRQLEQGKRYPLVLCVPGSGGIGNDNVKQMEVTYSPAGHLYTRYFNDDRFACYSLAPQMRPEADIPAPYWPLGELGKPSPEHPYWPLPNAEGWYTQATLALIEKLINDPVFQIDPERIYYAGYSYGGKACWEFLKAAPDRFTAAMCASGWPVGPAYSNPNDAQKELFRKGAEDFKHVPIRIFAGENDGMRAGSKAADEVLKQLGADSDYIEFPGANHFATAGRVWSNANYWQWLFEQNKTTKQAN